MAIAWTICEKPKLKHLKFLTLGVGFAMLAGTVRADEVHFNLRLTVHDYGRLVASSRACKLAMDTEGLKQSILDVARVAQDLDDDAISKTMDVEVQTQSHKIPGCSRAMTQIARAHLDRDLSDLKHAVDNQ